MSSGSPSPARGFRTLLLNLPYRTGLVRRFRCSYPSPSPDTLLPPFELLSLGGIAREWKQSEVVLLDAVAERADLSAVCRRSAELAPDLIVTLTGFECFDNDVAAITAVKSACPQSRVLVFGHYPTLFPAEFLEHVPADCVILGEPELTFSRLFDCFRDGRDPAGLPGIALRRPDGSIAAGPPSDRVTDLDSLPMPAYDLARSRLYAEPFFPRPYGTIESARGCPFACTFCVRAHGRKLVVKSPDRVLAEIRYWIRAFGIRSLKFVDDTFTVQPDRVIEICRRMVQERFDLRWSCLSRADVVEEDMLDWMRKAGCRRICFGIESGSRRLLDVYRKAVDPEAVLAGIARCRRLGIETVGFFIVGAPGESREDLEESIEFALRSGLDYVLPGELSPYPGTVLFEQLRDQIEFSLFPHRLRFKDPRLEATQRQWKKIFYRRFYFRTRYVLGRIRKFAAHPAEGFADLCRLAAFILSPAPEQKRDEFF